MINILRDRSLITGKEEGGYKTRGGGKSSFTPTKSGVEKSFSHARGEGTNSFEVVLTWELEVLAILKGGTKSFHPLKWGWEKFYTVLRWTQKGFGPAISPFCSPPPLLLIINYRSLMLQVIILLQLANIMGVTCFESIYDSKVYETTFGSLTI